jgi:hypothetical protein
MNIFHLQEAHIWTDKIESNHLPANWKFVEVLFLVTKEMKQ